MACCLLFFNDAPIPTDPRAFRPHEFQISMMEGLTKNQPVCCLAYFCAPCCAYYTRYRVLDNDLSRYTCCQGYLAPCGCQAGSCGESSCPLLCLVLEAGCCPGPSMSTSRLYLMDKYQLRSDPMDNQIMRCNN